MTGEKYIYKRNYGYVIIKKIENRNLTLGVFNSYIPSAKDLMKSLQKHWYGRGLRFNF